MASRKEDSRLDVPKSLSSRLWTRRASAVSSSACSITNLRNTSSSVSSSGLSSTPLLLPCWHLCSTAAHSITMQEMSSDCLESDVWWLWPVSTLCFTPRAQKDGRDPWRLFHTHYKDPSQKRKALFISQHFISFSKRRNNKAEAHCKLNQNIKSGKISFNLKTSEDSNIKVLEERSAKQVIGKWNHLSFLSFTRAAFTGSQG